MALIKSVSEINPSPYHFAVFFTHKETFPAYVLSRKMIDKIKNTANVKNPILFTQILVKDYIKRLQILTFESQQLLVFP